MASRASEALQFDFSVTDEVADEGARTEDDEEDDEDIASPTISAGAARAAVASWEGAPEPAGAAVGRGALEEAPPWDPYWETDIDGSAAMPPAGGWGSEAEPAAEPGASADAALSVAEFYERVRFALRAEFPTEVWVTGEIRKVTVNKGNRYLELADHDAPPGRGSAAMLDVACWSRDWPLIGAELQSAGLELTAGLVVRIRGKVGVWDGAAKLRFSMTDLDVAALLGGIAAARRKLLLELEREGLLDANRRMPVPLVPMRIGLVTSAGSEAYRDFTGQLERSCYAFAVRLEACLVQGAEAPQQIAIAIRRLQDFEPDVIVLVRGGGGRGDLAAFDSEFVARAIATSGHPVWTGIGHTGDRSVADEVCQRALITPASCGEAVVAAVTSYLEGIDSAAQVIAARGRAALDRAGERVDDGRGRLARAARHELDQASSSLVLARRQVEHGAKVGLERSRGAVGRQAQDLARISRHALQSEEQQLGNLRSVLAAFDPRRQLARGWSLTRTEDGRVLRSVTQLLPADKIVTMLADGNVTSSVEQLSRIEETT
ncbi:MAG: exodeoxyribonuclease VII large subunit [Acidimicrobiales bacterium]|jgi:exodeoxyribonuclease VII large subunit